jgi:glycosyltransferase involved in cell wall biosynthesis
MRVTFVTNLCPHYRVRTFEILAAYHAVTYYFFSAGEEWYWQQQHGTRAGDFSYEYLSGIRLGRTRITPTLISKLLLKPSDVFVKCINGRFALPVTYLIARLRKKPFVLWTGVWMTLQTPFHRLVFALTRHIYRNADAVVVYGEHVKRYLLSQGVAERNIFVAAHAVDNLKYSRVVAQAELEQLRGKLGISANQRVVLYLGRLEPNKGLHYLLEAFQQIRCDNVVLLFAGEGAEKQRLQRRIAESAMTERVRFSNYVPPDETLPYYALAYLLVLPSITTRNGKETWGLVVNEAMNQGCPVIATDAVGAAAGGLVRDGANGLVVPERDPQALAAALQRLLDQPVLRQQMSQNSRAIMAGWDNEHMVLGFRKALEYAMGNR